MHPLRLALLPLAFSLSCPFLSLSFLFNLHSVVQQTTNYLISSITFSMRLASFCPSSFLVYPFTSRNQSLHWFHCPYPISIVITVKNKARLSTQIISIHPGYNLLETILWVQPVSFSQFLTFVLVVGLLCKGDPFQRCKWNKSKSWFHLFICFDVSTLSG